MQAYISGIGIISPQKTFDGEFLSMEFIERSGNCLRCIEPSYNKFIEPSAARRMSRIIKMGITAAQICLNDAQLEMPDAIITGTALGNMGSTEKFLLPMIEEDEQFPSPGMFMHSIPNTTASQIAMQLQCENYNVTYVHGGFSFESALLDGMMLLEEKGRKNILIGSHDEMTENNFAVHNNAREWKTENVSTMELINSKTFGTIAGEGAAFFVLNNYQDKKNHAQIKGLKTIYKPESGSAVENKISELLDENKLRAEEIDAVIYGINGDARFDSMYYEIKNNYFPRSASAYYKHLCGEYQTSGGFALWLAAMILKTQTFPPAVLISRQNHDRIRHVVIYNQIKNIHHSVFLLSQC